MKKQLIYIFITLVSLSINYAFSYQWRTINLYDIFPAAGNICITKNNNIFIAGQLASYVYNMKREAGSFIRSGDLDLKDDSIVLFSYNYTEFGTEYYASSGYVIDSLNKIIIPPNSLIKKDTNSIKISRILRIKHALKDTIWLASVDSGIIKYDMKKTWTYYDKSNSPLFSNIVPYMDINRKTNEKWFVCASSFQRGYGAYYLGLVKLSDTGWTVWDTIQSPFYTPKFFKTCAVSAISVDSSGNLWIGLFYELPNGGYTTSIYTYNNGWTKFDSSNSPITNKFYDFSNPTCIYTDKKGIVWVAMGEALCKYQNGTWTRYEYPFNQKGHWVKSMAKDTNNNLWLSDNILLDIFNEDSIKGEILVIDFQGKSVEEHTNILSTFSVSPNPFTAQLAISYTLPQPAQTSLSLCDIQGNAVAIIAPEQQSEGTVNLYYDASALPAGTYLLTLRVGGQAFSKKIIKMN
ncbi:MAG: T9SS type A sorting domain-containing protein [Candidatus Kapabacteria bacterium]|nr:T9SS type A sorting domain-containing protein [Candidatus Kapabacteria bacterium]